MQGFEDAMGINKEETADLALHGNKLLCVTHTVVFRQGPKVMLGGWVPGIPVIKIMPLSICIYERVQTIYRRYRHQAANCISGYHAGHDHVIPCVEIGEINSVE